jgi:type I restriction enzyme S subunit
LRRAVLERAFRGELVPQDPSDEPAEALLSRIRATRLDAQTVTRRGR